MSKPTKPSGSARSLPTWPFSVAVSLLIAAMLATWLPHYLLWPWWPDLDAWAAIAQGWDRGIRPYRDVAIFNFPGQIEVAYVLGKLFGWGRTTPAYAFDAALLLSLGAALVLWSVRRFGRALPGLIAFAAVVSAYANLDYSAVAQRDWQGPLLAILGLLAIQVGRGRPGLIASAALVAMGFAIRPHVVLFVPAVGLALMVREGDSWKGKAARWIAWGFASCGFLLLIFSPLIVQGLLGDLVRGVRKAGYGSDYNQTGLVSVFEGIASQLGLDRPRGSWSSGERLWRRLAGWKILLILGSLVAVVARSDAVSRRTFAPWLVAMVLVLLYKPLHPKSHLYLMLPLKLMAACGLAVAAEGAIRLAGRWPWLGGIILVGIVGMAVPGVPSYCSIDETLRSFDQWKRADEPDRVPLVAEGSFRPTSPGLPGDDRSPYTWDEYRRTLAYLRRHTTPQTAVANGLRGVPFPPINGPVGRITPFPAESGLIWLWSVDPKAEAAFVARLQETPEGTVVVWSPGDWAFHPRLELGSLRNAIRREFRFERRFGSIEVWRKPRPDGLGIDKNSSLTSS